MNINETKEFAGMFTTCREAIGLPSNSALLAVYINALKKYDFQAIKKVMDEFLYSLKFPSIDAILSRIGEKVDSPEEQARLLSDKLEKAIGTFGEPQEKAAKEHFGEDWDIVTSGRTWYDLCSFENPDQLSYYLHQFRASALIRINQKRGEKIKRESLPSGDIIDTEAFSIVDDQIKTLSSSMDRT